MGNFYSYPDSVPPGGELLFVQRHKECCPPPMEFRHAKPFCLGSLPDQQWNVFQEKVQGICSRYRNEIMSFWPLGLFVLVMVPWEMVARELGFIRVVGAVVVMGLFIGMRLWIAGENEKLDHEIRSACAEFTASSGCAAEYRTAYTNCCRPKHAKPFRAIAFTPVGGLVPVGTQMISVTVPPGAPPGSTLQIQTPDGQMMNVQVPPGVREGQIFHVQPPPPQVVQATVVQAQVVA
jgi:hypothetical protein